jgi:Ca2+-transporting ATPase
LTGHGCMSTPSLTRYAWLSVFAAVLTIGLKTQAYFITGSVGLLSDAAESLVNLAAAVFALLMLSLAARPADAGHPFGHGKAEYFASGFEGALILVAAAGITWAAWERLMHPQPLAKLDIGMGISAGAAALNLAVALVLLRAGRRYGSITLEADGRHLLTDVWTTVAVLSALGGIAVTGWQLLDPIIAFLAAAQIVWAGVILIIRSVSGLMDAAIPGEEKIEIEGILDRYRTQGIQFHDLRARTAGTQRFMTVHVLVPGDFSVQEGHDLLERIEDDIRRAIRNITIVTHLEPLEDMTSFAHDRLETDSCARPEQQERGGAGQPKKRPIGAGRARSIIGALLVISGGIASMLLPDPYADFGLGVSMIGLVLSLSGHRKRNNLN